MSLTQVDINLQNKVKQMQDAKVAVNAAREEHKRTKEEFVAAMKAASKSEITVDGKKFELDFHEEYKIRVSKA